MQGSTHILLIEGLKSDVEPAIQAKVAARINSLLDGYKATLRLNGEDDLYITWNKSSVTGVYFARSLFDSAFVKAMTKKLVEDAIKRSLADFQIKPEDLQHQVIVARIM
jgi:hypothetical protein